MATYEDAVARVESGEVERPGPGKYEGNADRVLADMLDEISLDGCDEENGRVDEGGWYARIGRFVVCEDDNGFFGYAVYADEDEAKRAWEGVWA